MFAALDFVSLLPIAAFGVFATAAWLAMEWWNGRKPRAEQRLDEFSNPALRRQADLDGARRKGNAMTRVLEEAMPALSKPLQPKSEAEMGKLKQRLVEAGFRSEEAPAMFLGVKLLLLVLGLLGGGGTMALMNSFQTGSIMKSIAVAGVLFYVPEIVLWLIAKKRKESIFLGLPDALDLMVVCVEAGLGLDQAMRKVATEMEKAHRTIAHEFGLCNLHLQMGRSRNQVLQDLGARSGVEDLSALAAILIQADKFGSSIAQALRVQSESMRVRRRQIAEEKAAKTAVKLIFPLVLFIFPGIFVVLVGPAAITMVREMFPAMQGGG